ncbi:MAG: NADH-quinone oxidoreductase subunit K [Deltaproteobacteria bacterium]|jgi:multicomponent Na+:H+ antiporter subunit C|nr:NADH-quinone oxidoreductase subunit K [Deltaproteobacteria bacterium]
MEALVACLIGLMFAAALYLILSGNLVKFVFGFTLMGNAVNLLIFTAGRLRHIHPPLIPPDQISLSRAVSNALPQALILTAIVIGFAMVTFLLVLLLRTYEHTGTLDVDEASFLNEVVEDATEAIAVDQTTKRKPS